MSMYQGHRGMGGPPANPGATRLGELLEQIRAEFESQFRQSETYDHQGKPSLALQLRVCLPGAHRIMPVSVRGPWSWHRAARPR